MADNVVVDNGGLTDIDVATDKVTYSGDADRDVQLLRPIHVAGSEGAKTVEAVTGTTGAAVPAAAVGIGGTDGTNLRLVKVDSGGELQVDVLTSALPSGAATLAEQQAQTTHLDTLQATVDLVGTAVPTTALFVAGTDGTNSRGLKTDASGELQVDVLTLPALAAGTANIGDVDVASIAAGTNYIGKVRITDGTNDLTVDTAHGDAESNTENHLDVAAKLMGFNGTDWDRLRCDSTFSLATTNRPKVVRLSVTPTISTSAYTSGDVLGGQMTFSNAVRVSGGSGVIQSIVVLDKTQAQRAAMDLLFFDRSVTVAADNAAIAMSDADMANCLGVVTIGPYNTAWPGTPANSISTLPNCGLPIVLNGTDLYVAAVVRATPTYVATSDLVFTLTILQD